MSVVLLFYNKLVLECCFMLYGVFDYVVIYLVLILVVMAKLNTKKFDIEKFVPIKVS